MKRPAQILLTVAASVVTLLLIPIIVFHPTIWPDKQKSVMFSNISQGDYIVPCDGGGKKVVTLQAWTRTVVFESGKTQQFNHAELLRETECGI